MRFALLIKINEDFIREVLRKVYASCVLEGFRSAFYGRNSSVYRLKISSPTRVLCLRVSHNGEVGKEARISRMLNGLVRVPEIIAMGEGWLLTEWLPGMTLDEALEVVDVHVRREIAFSAGKTLAKIHSCRMDSFGYVFDGEKGFSDSRSFLVARLHDLTESPFVRQAFEPMFLEEIYSFCYRNIHLFEGHPCFLLGDFTGDNIHVINNYSSWRVHGVFDFGESFVGLREWDFCRFFRYVTDKYAEMKRPFLSGYEQCGTLPDELEVRVGVFDVFLMLRSVERVMMASIPEVQKENNLRRYAGCLRERVYSLSCSRKAVCTVA